MIGRPLLNASRTTNSASSVGQSELEQAIVGAATRTTSSLTLQWLFRRGAVEKTCNSPGHNLTVDDIRNKYCP